MKIVTVVGARPQFIKAAMVSRELSRRDHATEVIIHTGQHFDRNMSEVFFEQMAIPAPHYNLNIHSLTHGAMTGRMLEKIEEVLLLEDPDAVVVYGDTNSTLAGALAAKKLGIKVSHVEAGLRSFNMSMPEEVNRILTDRLSDLLMCPTPLAIKNLHNEGFDSFGSRLVLTGDVMQDAALFFRDRISDSAGIIHQLKLTGKRFALCTIHRAENTDDFARLQSIIGALNELAKQITIVLPLHPRTRDIIEKNGLRLDCLILEPVGYLDMIRLLAGSQLVLTDSGGLQKEAFFFEKPCVTLRDETEWVELVDRGFNELAGADRQKIVAAFGRMLNASLDFDLKLYGGGNAAKNIVDNLLS